MKRSLPFVLGLLLFGLAACTPSETEETASTTTEIEAPPQETVEAPGLPVRANTEARPSPNATVSQTIGTTVVTVTYGRPGVKGRDVFGGLEQYGAVWRAGANEATVFHTSDDVTINGQALPAGAYAFFVIPQENGPWTIIFNQVAEQWGAFDHDDSQDVLRLEVTPEEGPMQEWLEYSFEDLGDTSATAVLHWDTVRLPFTIATS